MQSKFDSVDEIVNYLRGPTVSSSSTIHSTIVDSRINKNGLKSSKKQQKEKNLNIINSVSNSSPSSSQSQSDVDIQILPKGRVKYGPITVNPRKQPSKTLFTGRRSKYEVLSDDEEEKRRDRRERNRVAATKCREKRENVLSELEIKHRNELEKNTQLLKMVNNLQQKKDYLQSVFDNHVNECPLIHNTPSQPSMIFGDPTFLSSIGDTLPPPLPSYQQSIVYHDEEEISHLLNPASVLTNSAYNTDDSNSILNPQPQSMTNSSIERLINTLQSPTISMESTNNNHTLLFNSAYGTSCAKQHTSSSEDDSLPPKHTNPYVY